MAFSKAKIVRFNEIEGCAPPPGAYDPKQDAKLVGGVLSKTHRFLEPSDDILYGLSRSACKLSTEDINKTPRTPKGGLRRALSFGKSNKVSSLQDLTKLGQTVRMQKMEKEITELRNDLDSANKLKSRLTQWMSIIENVINSGEAGEKLTEVLLDWNKLNVTSNMSVNQIDLDAELSIRENELSQAEKIIENLRDQLGDAKTNLNLMQESGDKAEKTVMILERQLKEKVDNYERIIDQLQTHLNVCQEEKLRVENDLSLAETKKFSFQQKLLEKCDLLDEFIKSQGKLKNELDEANNDVLVLKDDIKNLQEQSEINESILTGKIKELEQNYEKSQELIESLQLELLTSEQMNRELEHSKNELLYSVELQEANFITSKQEISNLNELLRFKDDELNSMSMLLVNTEQEKNHVFIELKELLNKQNVLVEELNGKLNYIKNLEVELQETKEGKSLLQVHLASVENNVDILKEKLFNIEDNYSITLAKSVENEEQSLLLQMQLTAADDLIHKLKIDLDDKDIMINELKANLLNVHEENKNLAAEVLNYTKSFQEMAKTANMNDENIKALQKEAALKQTVLEQLEALRDVYIENTNLVKENSDLLREYNRVNDELADTNNKLTTSLENEQKIKNTVKLLQSKIQEFNKEIENAEKLKKEQYSTTLHLSRMIDDMQVAVNEAKRQHDVTVNDLHSCKKEVTSFKEKYENVVKSNEKLQRKLTGTKNVHKSTLEKLSAAEETISVLENTQKELKGKENKLLNSIKSQQEKILNLEGQISNLRENKSTKDEEYRSVISELKSDLNKMQEILKTSQEERMNLENHLSNSEQNISKLQGILAETEDNCKILKESLIQSENNIIIIQEELMHAKEHLQEHMSQANKNISTLNEQLTSLSLENKRLENDLSLQTALHIEAQEKFIMADAQKSFLEYDLTNVTLCLEEYSQRTETWMNLINEMHGETNSAIDDLQTKIKLILEQNNDLQENNEELVNKNYALEQAIADNIDEKINYENNLYDMKTQYLASKDELFDIKQHLSDLRIAVSSFKNVLLAMENDKKNLEEEYAKAEKEWDQREQELQQKCKLFSDEVQLGEEKQIELENKIIELEKINTEIKLKSNVLQQDCDWNEKRQLELEELINKLKSEKEQAFDKIMVMNLKLDNVEKESLQRIETCKQELKKVTQMFTNLQNDLMILKNDFDTQDEEMGLLQDTLTKKEKEIEALRNEIDSKNEDLKEKSLLLEKTETELTKLRKSIETRSKMADELEELLQRKLNELGETRDHLNTVEDHAKSLDKKLLEANEAEQRAIQDKMSAELQTQRLKNELDTVREEFSQRWSTMEDSLLNVETIEARNRDLSATEKSQRSQLSTLETEVSRLRDVNSSMRERLSELELKEAKFSGHQNQAQKITYMQNLKEIIMKYQKTEEDLHSKLVETDCRAAQLEAELQRRSGNTSSILGNKSMLQQTISTSAKKSVPNASITSVKRRGKENSERAALSEVNRSSFMTTSTPLTNSSKFFHR